MIIDMRPASEADLDTILRWRVDTAKWLATQGTDQWGLDGLDQDEFVSRVRRSIAAGETWMAAAQHDPWTPIGTIAIDSYSDPGLWSVDELASALFVHRMIVPAGHRGEDIGGRMLKWSQHLARRAGLPWVRLDAWTSNTRLHAYYRSQGWRLARLVDDAAMPSAALMEIPAEQLAGEPVSAHGIHDSWSNRCSTSWQMIDIRLRSRTTGGPAIAHIGHQYELFHDGHQWWWADVEHDPIAREPVMLSPCLDGLGTDRAHIVRPIHRPTPHDLQQNPELRPHQGHLDERAYIRAKV